MDSVVKSNHTCMAYTYDIKNATVVAQRPPIETEVLTINTKSPLEREVVSINGNNYMTIQQKIRRKVVLALCGVDGGLFDLSHLNDLPLQLMPRVLALIQEHTSMRITSPAFRPVQFKKDALSRLFHALRGWELPLLFENLRASSATDITGKRKRKAGRRCGSRGFGRV